ncbi:MAG: hypothetical protein U0802_18070 [Candidatus Binatia bacterium]
MGYGHRHHHHGHDCCEHGHRQRHHHCHCDDHEEQGGEFDEKRVIDTIVDLVGERVGRMLEARQEPDRPRDGGDEKRVIDLVVGLVAEKVREIVADELERRGLGRSPSAPAAPPAEPR